MRALLVASALLSALAFSTPLRAADETAVEPAPTLPAITVSTVETRLLRDRVIVSGLVNPVEEVQVAPLIEGQPIETLLADVGDWVTEGQVLATLSKTTLELQKSQYQASLASAEATIAQSEAQLLEAQASADEAQRVNERTAALKAQGTASQAAADQASANAIASTARVTVAVQSLEAARAQLSLVQAQLANVDLQLSRTEVKAPVAGEITRRNAVIGSIASGAGQPMFTLIRDGALELSGDVAEIDLMRLAPGQTVSMIAVGAPDRLTGTVRLVEPTIDTTTRLGRARITIDEPDGVRAGMFMDAEILVAERETIAVPVTAVGASSEGSTVMKVTDGTVARIPVKTGIRDGGWIEIVEGLSPGDTVVTKAGAFVRDGDKINPVPVAMN
ncbi:efflux RND transporter periplasmic adaptor subunit [Tabrizicola sp. TH137]|uniref:efflux RND transporter periplasmic adaptor subunit n=1 Tax=Tabrizicola sp. TH137 TaxID=2067452 RepID=UPI000C7B474B|nr:efflux RND transporter periplasmic adaptor subunit [Tabrizicola sp. TH137]PLL14735.1 efflux RND transporter periplasmic adaptor subunit [Tabrizicola sp. TH137]